MLYEVWFSNDEFDPTGCVVKVYDNHFAVRPVVGVLDEDGYWDWYCEFDIPSVMKYGFPSLAGVFQFVSGEYGSFRYAKVFVQGFKFLFEENPDTVRTKVHEYKRNEVFRAVEFQTIVGAIEYVEGELACQE